MIANGGAMDFSKKVKKVRKKLGLSQRELAQALSVSFATINRWENGHVIPSNLAKKSFYDFCESNFINLEEIDNE